MAPIVDELHAGIDWLSTTLEAGSPGYAEWRNHGLKALERISREGYVLKQRGMLGYYGLSAGNCFVGEREKDSLIQLTGHQANVYFEDVYRNDLHVSRIDVQITVKTKENENDIAKLAYRDATTDNNSLPVGRRRKLYIIMGSDGGDTLYIGSPKSDQRGRIYNKEVQSENPAYTKCWRFETQYRNEWATDVARRIHASASDHSGICAGLVANWFSLRGVDVNWFYTGSVMPAPLVRTLPTDIEAKMHWLETQVKPTIAYLCELGYYDTLLISLFPPQAPETVYDGPKPPSEPEELP